LEFVRVGLVLIPPPKQLLVMEICWISCHHFRHLMVFDGHHLRLEVLLVIVLRQGEVSSFLIF